MVITQQHLGNAGATKWLCYDKIWQQYGNLTFSLGKQIKVDILKENVRSSYLKHE